MEDKIQRHIILNNYTYTYKDALKNLNYTYRCKHRTICKVTIKIDKENILKYNQNLLNDVKFSYINDIKDHTCQKLKINDNNTEENNNTTIHYKELAKSLIYINITKIIDKVCNYVLEFLYDDFNNENQDNSEEKGKDDLENYEENEYAIENETENRIISNDENKAQKDYIDFNEFYPKVLKKKEKGVISKLLDRIMKSSNFLTI